MSLPYLNAESSTGTCTVTAAASPGTTHNLTTVIVSQAGPTSGVNAKVTVWDGAVGTGTKIYSAYLNGPGAVGTGIGSVGTIQDVPLPKNPNTGAPGLQGTPGNAMNVQVTGTGANAVSLNCRIGSGLPVG